MRPAQILLTILFFVSIISCSGPNATVPTDPDMQFGHRYAGVAPDGYDTVTIRVPDEGEFSSFPATFDYVIVRPDRPQMEKDSVAVEILVKGSLPEACMELHAFDRKRTGNIITATLQMRRPRSRICAAVRRPYRLYLMLDGKFLPGQYTLKLNDRSVPFIVPPRQPPS